jgi:hypothetical protein
MVLLAPTRHIIARLRSSGVVLQVNQDRLDLVAPHGVLTPDLKAEIRERKTAIIAFLATEASLSGCCQQESANPPVEECTDNRQGNKSGMEEQIMPGEQTPLTSLPRDPFASWRALADSGLEDVQAVSLDQAVFLFAIRKVERTPPGELAAVWARHGKYWRERLPRAAYELVLVEYQQRVNRQPRSPQKTKEVT